MKNLDWLDEIDLDDILTGDMKIIRDRCGMDVLKSLLANIPKINIYLSEKPLVQAQKRYIEKHYHSMPTKQIAVRLGVSERFVFKTHREIVRAKQKSRLTAGSLFDQD